MVNSIFEHEDEEFTEFVENADWWEYVDGEPLVNARLTPEQRLAARREKVKVRIDGRKAKELAAKQAAKGSASGAKPDS